MDVDLRVRSRAHENVDATGGVAVHESDGTTWRIDHWSDVEAQGFHAARSVLASVGLVDSPGPYEPLAIFSALIHQHLYIAAGDTDRSGAARTVSTTPLALTHERAGRLVGAGGLDAGTDLMAFVPHLHASITPMLTAGSGLSTYTP